MSESFPEVGETIVCKVSRILDYGVFVELIEYGDLTGFVHISQVSSSWIKNIRNFVKENQVRAAQVIGLDAKKRQVDLSFNKVSKGIQRAKIEAWKQSKRAQKLLELIAAKNNSSLEVVQKEVGDVLLEHYDSLYDAFQEIKSGKKEALKLVSSKWLAAVKEVIEKNVEVTQKELTGMLSISSSLGDGLEHVKKALFLSQKAGSEDAKLDIIYTGSGKYLVKALAFDYKDAEKALKKAASAAEQAIKSVKGNFAFSKGS